jgi:transposase
MRRANVVKLVVDRGTHGKLKELGTITAKCWNEVNLWNYSYIVKRFEEVGEELGIRVVKVDEPYTSKTCSLCGDT